MPATKTSPEGSPRSMFRKFFHMKEDKTENDALSDKKTTYQNEYSQTQNLEESEAEKDLKNEPQKINGQSEKSQKEKRKRSIENEESSDEIPVKDGRKSTRDDLDPSKLTTIINNSIKEAVRNIVKDGVCDFIDSHEPKKPRKSKTEKEIKEDVTPTKDKDKSTLLTSEEKKTFDSHASRAYTTQRLNKSPERGPVAQCDRSICPAYVDEPEKLKRKKTKQKSHFSTDNRRMTGNVNIYICSEANENVKNKSQEKVCSASETESEMKSSTSASSVSTTKLVNALKKKRRKKIDDGQELECLCEEPEESIEDTEQSTKKLTDIPEEMSSISRLNYPSEHISSTDYLDGCSLDNCPALSSNYASSFDYRPYGNSWEMPRSSMRNYSYLPAERDIGPQESFKKDVCCACKKQKPDVVPCPYDAGPRLNSVATNYPEDHEVFTVCTNEAGKYEEQENSCCVRGGSVEEFTVCTNQPIDVAEEFTVCCNTIQAEKDEEKGSKEAERKSEEKPDQNLEGRPVNSDSVEVPAETDQPEATPDPVLESEVQDPKDNRESGELPETPETLPEEDKKESIFVRLWRKAVALVRKPKPPPPESELTPNQTPENSEKLQNSDSKLEEQESLRSKPKSASLSTLQSSQTLRKERRLKTKIVSRISSKQKQKELTQSDSKIPSDSSPAQIEIVPSPENIQTPGSETTKPPETETESLKPQVNCKCGDSTVQEAKSEAPKLVPCTFTHEEEPQEECGPIELGKCRCQDSKNDRKYEPKEQQCCTCRLETSCCTCKPMFNAPKRINKKTCKPSCRSCCNPLNRCTCRAPPSRKCSYCGMPVDICNCHRRNLWTEGRSEKNGGIRETSGYFPRDLRKNPDNCRCDKTRPYGSEELPYQKLNVFSNVMTELQQKISDSTYCPQCNNAMCCCPKTPCLSTIAERPNSPRANESPQSCKCSRMKKTTFAICDVCQTSPCRCRRDKRPQAKCFYCKTLPCRCNWTNDNKRRQPTEQRRKVPEKRLKLCQCSLPNSHSNKYVNRHRNPQKTLID